MKLVTAVDFDAEDLAVLDRVVPLLDIGPKIIHDKQAMRNPRTLQQVAHAIRAAITQQREHYELWAAHGADLEARGAAVMRPGAADHMVALTTRNMEYLTAARDLIDQAIAATTPEEDPA